MSPGCEIAEGLPYKAVAVGSYLPEFEWAHHLPTGLWRSLVAAHDKIVVVSGNNLPSMVPFALGRKALSWIASPYWADRKDRFEAWPAWRRTHDLLFNGWVARWQEQRLLREVDTWTISDYALRELRALAPANRIHGTIVIPIDTELFHPGARFEATSSRSRFRVGFAGRVSDPRKNMALLVESFSRFHRQAPDSELHIRGDMSREAFLTAYGGGELGAALMIDPPTERAELPAFLRSLDCFALMSHQEGLSLIALEAMACGTSVISTRCGGPEDFVMDESTGLLIDFDAGEACNAMSRLATDFDLRDRIARRGSDHVRTVYAPSRFKAQFEEAMAIAFS